MNREQFLEYMDHFNNHRWDKVTSYFRPDVTLEYPDNFGAPGTPGRTLHGPQEFIANYQAIAANVREVLNLGAFMSYGSQFFVEFITEFHVFRDPPEGTRAMGKKGDVVGRVDKRASAMNKASSSASVFSITATSTPAMQNIKTHSAHVLAGSSC